MKTFYQPKYPRLPGSAPAWAKFHSCDPGNIAMDTLTLGGGEAYGAVSGGGGGGGATQYVDLPGYGRVKLNGTGKKTINQLAAYYATLPSALAIDQQYQPQFNQLDLNNLQAFLSGAGPAFEKLNTSSNTATRTANLGDLSTLGPGFVNALKSANPGQTALTDALTKTATDNLNLGDVIDPATSNRITSGVRSNWAGRGLGDSMPAGLDEALQLFGGGQNLLQSRETAAGSVANLNANLYEDPLLSMMNAPSPAPQEAAAFAPQGGGNVLSPSDLQSLFSGVYNAQNAAAMNSANNKAALCGAGIGAAGSVAGGAAAGAFCWAAREIFGANNPQWLQFREWLLLDAPAKLRNWYVANGENWAMRLRGASSTTREAVQRWMCLRTATIENRYAGC